MHACGVLLHESEVPVLLPLDFVLLQFLLSLGLSCGILRMQFSHQISSVRTQGLSWVEGLPFRHRGQ